MNQQGLIAANDTVESRQSMPMAVPRRSPTFSLLSKADIFSYLPVPVAKAVSSRGSILGSIFLLIVFFSYVISTFYLFCTDNPPRINTVLIPVDDTVEYLVPAFAFTFVYGQDLNASFYDPTYFTYTYQQATVYKNTSIPRSYINSPLVECNRDAIAPWLGTVDYTNIFCPSQQLHMQGLLYSAEKYQFARIKIEKCHSRPDCQSEERINSIIQGGRLFFFLRKNDVVNHSTGELYPQSFSILNYYLVSGLYQKNTLLIQKEQQIIKEDYIHRFSEVTRWTQHLANQHLDVQMTPGGKELSLIQLSLDEDLSQKEYFYKTLILLIGEWGALWGVVYAVLAFGFIAYHQKEFYSQQPHWRDYTHNEGALRQHVDLLETQIKQLQEVTQLQGRDRVAWEGLDSI